MKLSRFEMSFSGINNDMNFLNKKYKKGILMIYSYIVKNGKEIPLKTRFKVYRLSGIEPQVAYDGITDDYGRAYVRNLDFGYYRLIEVANSQKIKPKYIPWNEFEINQHNLAIQINIKNKSRESVKQNYDKLSDYHNNEKNENDKIKESDYNGNIIVKSVVHNKSKEPLCGAKFSIFRINDCKAKLIESRVTNSKGLANFCNLKRGKYIILENINKNLFHKPIYINGQIVSLDDSNKNVSVVVVNKLK